MPRTLVWDLPVRLFHWSLVAGFIGAAVISIGLGEHSPSLAYHAVLGLVIAALVCVRLIWGVVGSRHARLWSFAWGPGAVASYFKGILVGGGRKYSGHNPGSAWAIFAMLALVLGLAATGVMLGRGNEGVKDVHEVMAYALTAVAVAHVLGVATHTVRHRENITASMVHGRKNVEQAQGIRSAHPVAALVMIAVVGVWAATLVRSYDAATGVLRVPVVGVDLRIAENDRGSEGGRRDRRSDDD